MHGDMILLRVEDYLTKMARGEESLPDHLVTGMLERMKERFLYEHKKEFRIVMSNAGKPLCQLQMESKNAARNRHNEHTLPIKFAIGDMLEHWLMAVLEASGVPVTDTDIRCELDILGQRVGGIADIDIGNEIWDIKSTSAFQYRKYQQGFAKVYEDDPFGYIVQGALYEEALNRKFAGWIVINKNSGDICVCRTPINWETKYKPEALKVAEIAVKTLQDDAPFRRSFNDEDETWYKKTTGNRILGFNCSYCEFKEVCWPGVQRIKSPFSKAKEGKYFWYTEFVNDNSNNTKDA